MAQPDGFAVRSFALGKEKLESGMPKNFLQLRENP
jgi:hypothetical protein